MGPVGYLATATMPRKRDGAPRTQFAKLLQEWADQHGITRKDLEDKTGYKSAQIGNYLRGDYGPSQQFLTKLIRAFDLPAEEWWTAAGYNALTHEPLDEREDIAERAVRKALTYDASRFQRDLLETLAEYYQESSFLIVHRAIPPTLAPDAARETVIRWVQQIEAVVREQRRSAGDCLPPPLFVAGE